MMHTLFKLGLFIPTRHHAMFTKFLTCPELSVSSVSSIQTFIISKIYRISSINIITSIVMLSSSSSSSFRLLEATAISSCVALYAYKKRKLTPNACIAAFSVGTIISLSGHSSTAALLTFFLTASKITSFGKQKKLLMSEKGSYDAAGNRNVKQVLCNSAAAVAIIFYDLLVVRQKPLSSLLSSPSSLACQLAVVCHFAGTNGDTFSSEIGVLSKSTPRLILNPFRKVPAGTNGGVTLLGLGAAALGGFLVGGISLLTNRLLSSDENQDQNQTTTTPVSSTKFIFGGIVAAVGCSLVDSVLGMTLQYSGEAEKNSNGDEGESVVVVVTEDPSKSKGKQIAGWCNLLSNDGVNLVSAMITTYAAYEYFSE